MKLDNKARWFLYVCGVLLIAIFGINYCLIKSESKMNSVKSIGLMEKTKSDSQWLSYQKIRGKLFNLTGGWKRPVGKPNTNRDLGVALPIKDAIDKQIAEIERIHEEEIAGKLKGVKRIYQEYRQKLIRDLEFQYQERVKACKIKLEADLAEKRERQAQVLADFRKDLGRKHQLTLINLELQKKMLIFNSQNQQHDSEEIDLEISRIREDLKKEVDQYKVALEKEFERYKQQKKAEYNEELERLRQEKQQLLQVELNRFQEEQMKQFQLWKDQRQTEVKQGIELRRIQ